jgi:hypothetical protein
MRGPYRVCIVRVVIRTGLSLATAILIAACGPDPLDHAEDFTEEVERVCADYCEINLACREPAWFESYDACEQTCLHATYIYNDTPCGEAMRAIMTCVGSQPTCELYNDTLNVHADEYTCQAETEHRAELSTFCSQSDEEPYPKGKP